MDTSGGYASVPRWVVGVATIGALFILLPLVGIVTHVDWAHFLSLIT